MKVIDAAVDGSQVEAVEETLTLLKQNEMVLVCHKGLNAWLICAPTRIACEEMEVAKKRPNGARNFCFVIGDIEKFYTLCDKDSLPSALDSSEKLAMFEQAHLRVALTNNSSANDILVRDGMVQGALFPEAESGLRSYFKELEVGLEGCSDQELLLGKDYHTALATSANYHGQGNIVDFEEAKEFAEGLGVKLCVCFEPTLHIDPGHLTIFEIKHQSITSVRKGTMYSHLIEKDTMKAIRVSFAKRVIDSLDLMSANLDLNDIYDIFNSIDTNGDKGLCEEEFYNFVLKVNASSKESTSEEDASVLFKAIDINGDKEISFIELFQFLEYAYDGHSPQMSKLAAKFVSAIRSEGDDIQDVEAIMRLFEKIDTDNSNDVDKKELRDFLLSHEFSSVEIDVLFALIDKTLVEDDSIHFMELYEFLQSIQADESLQDDDEEVEVTVEKADDNKLEQVLEDDVKSDVSKESLEVVEESEEVLGLGLKVIDAAVDGSQVEAVEETLTLLKQNEMVLVCHKGLNAWLICAPTRIACEEMEVAKKRPNGARNFCFVIGDIEKFYTLCDKDSLPSALDSSEKLAMFEQAHLRVALTNNSSANDILVRDGMVQGALFPEAESGLRSYFKELEVGLEGCSDQELLLGKDYHTALATSANYHGQGNIVDFEEAKEFAEGLGVKLCVCFEPTLHIDPGHLTIFEIKHQSITSVRKGTMYSHLIEKDTMKAIRVSFAKRVIDSLDLMSANLDLNDIYDIFNSIDTNGDKGLCEEEFYNFVLKVNASSKESTSEEDASVLFKAIDINGDKEISFIELFQFLEYAYDGHSPQMSKLAAKFVSAIRSEGDDIQDVEAIMRLFEKIDTDNSNDVDKKELRDFLLSHEFSSVEIDVLFALIDKTLVEDDSIHFMELYEFLQSIQADESLQDDDEEVEVTVEKADDNKLEQVLEDDVKSDVSKESLEVVEESEEVLGLGLKVIDAAVDGSQVEAVEETLTLLKQNEMVLVCHKGLNAWLICAPTRIACEEMEVAKKRPNGARNFCFVIGDIEKFYTLCDKDSLPSALDSSEKLAMFEQAHLRVALTNNSSANDILVRDGMVQGALFPEAESGLRSYFKELEVGLEGCSDQELLLGKDYHTALATSANYHGQGNIVDFEEAKEFAEGLGVKLCVCFEPTLHIDPGHLTIFEIKHQSITSVRKGTMYSHLIEKDTMKAIRVSFAKRVIDSLDLMSANLDLNDIYDIFNSIDTNGDKGLCEEEFYNFVLKVNASSKESTSEEDASVLFKAIDINGDKEISFIELFQFLEYAYDGHSPQMSKLAAKFVSAIRSEGDDIQDVEAIMRLFEKIDTDNSNDVDKKELRDFLLSHEFSSVEIDVLFALIDKTLVEDDSIHFMELYEFLQSIQADESLQDDDEEVEVTVEKADDNKLEQVLEDDVKSDVSKESLEVVEESEEVLGLGLKVIDAAVDGSQVEAVEETLTLLKQNEMVLVCHKGLNAWLICAPTRIACEEMEVAKKRPNGARNFCFVIGDIEKFYTLCDKDSLPSALDSSEKLAMFEQAHLRVALTNNSSANDILVRDGMVQGALFPEAESGLRSYFKELEVGLEGCSDQELLLGKDYHTALATSANYHGQGNIVDFEEAKEFAEGLGVKLCVCFEPTLHIDPGHLTIFEIKHQSITSVRKGTMYSHLIEKDTMKAIRVSFAKRVIDSLDLMSANLDLNDIYDIFNSIDTNGDKGLCEEEFYNFVLKVNASSKESTSEEDASVLFKAIDINGDKEISFIELFQFLEYAYDGHSPQMSKLAAKFVSAIRSEGDDIQDVEAIMRLFEKIDTDNSNDVDKKELRDFLLSHEFSSVEIDVLFALIDKTLVEDDSIHFMELYEFLQSIQADESLQDDDEEVEVTVEKADDNKLEQVLEDDVKSDVSKESLEVVEESEEVLGLGLKVIDAAVDGSQVEAVEETLTLLKQNEMVLVCHKGLNAWLICAPTRIACEEMEVAKKRPNGARNFCFVIGDIEKFYTLCDKDSLPSALDSSEKLAMFEQAHLRVALTNNSSANDILVRDGMVQGALFPEAESGLRSYFKELEVGLEGCSDQELLLGKDYHTALATSANYHGQGNIVDFEEAKEFAEGLGVKLCVCFEPTLHIDPGHLTIFEIKHQSITSVRKGTMYSHLIEKDTMKAIRVSFAKRVIDSLDLMSANLDLNDIYDIFNSIDTNGDKGLCEEEFYNFVLKVNASSKESTSEEDASVLFKAIDINGDKEISFIELFQFLEYAYDGHSPQMSKLAAKFVSAIRSEGDDIQDVEAIMRLFEKIDTDNSNDVDKKELRDFLLSHEFSSVEIDVLFALIDKTLVEDDSIHFMELYEFLQSIQADESLQDDDEEVEVTVEKADDNKLEQVLEDDVKSDVSKESLEVVEESEEVLGLGLKVIDAAVDGSQVEAVEETLTLLKQNEMVLVCHKGLNAWLICAPTRIACEEMEVAKKRPNGARNFCFVIGDIEKFYTLCDKDSLPSALDSSEKLAMFEQAHLRVALTNNSSANDILVRDGMVQGALFPEAESGLRSYFKELEVGLEGCSDQELLLGKDYHTALATSANYHGQGNIVDFEEAKEFAEGLGVKLCVCFEPTLHIDPGHLTIFEIKHQSITSVRKGTMYSHLIEKDTMKAIRVSFAKRVIDSLDLMSANLDLNDIYDIFNSIDTNGDKGLCEEEFYNFVLKVNASNKESTSEEDASVLFKAIDINGDKEISFIELFQFLEYAYDGHSPQMSKLAAKFVSAIRSEGDDIQDVEAIMRLFEKIDTDNSNDVDKKELRDFLLSHEFSSVEIDVLFALIDKTLVEDDSIHFMELYEFLQSIQADESLQDESEEVEVTVEKAEDNKLEQLLEDDVKSDVSKESLEVVEASEEVEETDEVIVDEVSEVEHLVEDNVKSDASNSSLEVAEESEEVKESEQAMAADDNELEQENDVKSDEPKESLEEGEESEEVKEEESEEVDETANDEGTDIVIDEDEPKQTEVETVSNKKVSTKFEDQPTKIRISTAKTRASVASNSMHTKSTAASSSRPRSRGRSPGAVHLRLYDVSASYQEEGRMKRLEVENRLRKIAEEKNGYYPGGKNRQMHNARRDSFRNEFQKPQGKITVAQAVSLYDRLVSLKQKTEEKKLLLRKERQERELMYIPR